jgi:ubiquinol-cytochrome c reductase cytochrome b subunit
MMMATAFMGYVLPWGQMSFWGATVISGLFTAIPEVGTTIHTWLLGGFSVGNATLNRFFAFHFMLPFLIVGVVILHLIALHHKGSNNPTGVEVKSDKDTIPFHPYYTYKDLLGFCVFFFIFFSFVFFAPNVLGHPDNYIPANPMVTPPHIVPEWYFLPFYAILRSVPDKLGGVICMFGAIAILFFLPWLDGSKVKSSRYKPIYRLFTFILYLVFIGLGYIGACPVEPPYVAIGQCLSIWYFLHFLVIVPFVSRKETPKQEPDSISADWEKTHS